MSAAAARPSLLERLQAQVTKLEREAAYLRQVDKTMQERLRAAVEDSERRKKTVIAQAETIADLRRQLDARSLEVAHLRADLEAARLARPATPTPPSQPPEMLHTGTRFSLLEVDD